MFLLSYSIRRVMTQFFMMQMEAEKTRDSVTQILDNLPDAVIMLESNKLQYCNKQADNFFGVDLSKLSQTPENQLTL
jgi:nitrogen-specific signal transduction histidine kinase